MLARALAFITTFVACFFAYGFGRTMVEVFGLSAKGVFAGLFICMFAVIPILGAVFAYSTKSKTRPHPLILVIVIAMVLAPILSEAHVLANEVAFAKESVEPQHNGRYARARAWPNGTGGLAYAEGQGLWATD